MDHRRFRTLLTAGLLTAVYFVAGKLSLKLAFLYASASPVWPPAGIALAAEGPPPERSEMLDAHILHAAVGGVRPFGLVVAAHAEVVVRTRRRRRYWSTFVR